MNSDAYCLADFILEIAASEKGFKQQEKTLVILVKKDIVF
jgi:hypothetical protein